MKSENSIKKNCFCFQIKAVNKRLQMLFNKFSYFKLNSMTH